MTPPPFTPYGLPTILELLRVLVALLNPSDQAHTDSMRYAALAVLNTALEVGGKGLGTWPELREGVRDEGCKYLFQVSVGIDSWGRRNARDHVDRVQLWS